MDGSTSCETNIFKLKDLSDDKRLEKSIDDFRATIKNLESCLKASKRNKEMYRVVATQLWILVADRDALIPRLFPKAKFHRLIVKPQSKMDEKKKIGKDLYEVSFNMVIPGLMGVKWGKMKIITIFDETRKPIKFRYWIDQPLFSKDFTIREFIKLIRHKEGAHSDPKAPQRLRILKKFFIENDDMPQIYITKIAEYVLFQCKILNEQLPK